MRATDRVKKCEYCGKEFHNPYATGIGVWDKRKFCSLECFFKGVSKKVEITCLGCGTKVRVSPSRVKRTKFCSKECYKNNSATYRDVESKCASCGKLIKVKKHLVSHRNYCSDKCKKDVNKIDMLCVVCHRPFRGIRSRPRKTCSPECKKLWIRAIRPRGSQHPNWRGGVNPESKNARGLFEYKDWRKAVFERDAFTCQVCGKTGVYIQAHHIEPFAYNKELRYELSNGITLCRDCHSNTDTFCGKARNYLTNYRRNLS